MKCPKCKHDSGDHPESQLYCFSLSCRHQERILNQGEDGFVRVRFISCDCDLTQEDIALNLLHPADTSA